MSDSHDSKINVKEEKVDLNLREKYDLYKIKIRILSALSGCLIAIVISFVVSLYNNNIREMLFEQILNNLLGIIVSALALFKCLVEKFNYINLSKTTKNISF